MSDVTIPDPDNRKKIMFYDSPERHARLKIRCNHDGINQSQFLRMVVTGYIESDKNLKAKFVGGTTVVGVIWTLLLKFWDKIF